MFSKKEFRTFVKSELAKISPVEFQKASQNIFQNLQHVLSAQEGVWGAFQPLADEPSLDWSQLRTGFIDWAFPVVNGSTLIFKKTSTRFLKTNWGINEPMDGQATVIQKMNGIIVPGLAFHHQGYRLGRGKGFYDQNFNEFHKTRIGLCFDFAFSEKVPFESHDLKMDYVITEKQIYKIK